MVGARYSLWGSGLAHENPSSISGINWHRGAASMGLKGWERGLRQLGCVADIISGTASTELSGWARGLGLGGAADIINVTASGRPRAYCQGGHYSS